MNLKALVLGAAFAASSCAGPRPVCYNYGGSLSCTQEYDDLVMAYNHNFFIGKTKEPYCALVIGLKSSKERTHYIDYLCDETVDECVYESSEFGFGDSGGSASGGFSKKDRSSFGSRYDSFFKRKKNELLEGKK